MTLAAWGLVSDFVGVLLIGLGTLEIGGDQGGYIQGTRGISSDRLALWSKRLGWLFLLAGLGMQLVDELTRARARWAPLGVPWLAWLSDHPELVVAFASLVLAGFAGVQIVLDLLRRRRMSAIARATIVGPSWLARRTLEEAIRHAGRMDNPLDWSRTVGDSRSLNPVQEQMLEVVRLGAEAGGATAKAAGAAFREFLAYADRVNYAQAVHATTVETGYTTHSPEELETIRSTVSEAIEHLQATVEELTVLAPRQRFEPKLPSMDQVQMLMPPTDPDA